MKYADSLHIVKQFMQYVLFSSFNVMICNDSAQCYCLL